MRDTIEITYRKPLYSSPVKNHRNVGMIDSDKPYCCEAVYGNFIGYGNGDTPAEARRDAAKTLRRRLREYMRTGE